jgi:hypothetical protein
MRIGTAAGLHPRAFDGLTMHTRNHSSSSTPSILLLAACCLSPGASKPCDYHLLFTMAELDVERFFKRLGKLHSQFVKHK